MAAAEVSRTLVRYATVRSQIADGDLLLYRRRGLRARTRRAAMAAWWGKSLFCIEAQTLWSGWAVTLSSQVRRYPGRIDVYEANPADQWPQYRRAEAVHYMRCRACGFDRWATWLAGWRQLWALVQRLWKPWGDSWPASSVWGPQALALACRVGGHVDPLPQLAADQVEAADLARSPFYRYCFTLIP